MDRIEAAGARLGDEVDQIARRYTQKVCDNSAPAETEGAELTALVLMRNYIDARLAAKGPYISEYSPPARPGGNGPRTEV